MWTWLKSLWLDPAYFRAALRAMVFAVGEMLRNGTIPTGADGIGLVVGPYIQAAALLLRAGEMNPSGAEAKK